MMQKADRYSCITLHVSELPERLEQANALGLKYFVMRDGYRDRDCHLYIFFDDAGMNNYLASCWGDVADSITEIVRAGIESGEQPIDTLNKIKVELGLTQERDE